MLIMAMYIYMGGSDGCGCISLCVVGVCQVVMLIWLNEIFVEIGRQIRKFTMARKNVQP